MYDRASYDELDRLTSKLPFHLNDVDRVNEMFVLYQADPTREAEFTLELWTYCFVRRYFVSKLLNDSNATVSELDDLVTRTYQKIREHRSRVSTGRYASWVSVVCRNTFLNQLRTRRVFVPIEDCERLVADSPDPSATDAGIAYQALSRAIERLPAFLQEVARLRFAEDKDYEEISRRVSKPLPIVRSYAYKVIRRLRKDSQLRAHLDMRVPERESA